MDTINLYTCTRTNLEALHKVGPDTASKLIGLREEVLAGHRPTLQLADFVAVRLTAEEWQDFIDALPGLLEDETKETETATTETELPKEASFQGKVSQSITLLAKTLETLAQKVYDLGTKLTNQLDTV